MTSLPQRRIASPPSRTPTGRPVCITHNDFFNLNILIDRSDRMHLIDWEYAACPIMRTISAPSPCAASFPNPRPYGCFAAYNCGRIPTACRAAAITSRRSAGWLVLVICGFALQGGRRRAAQVSGRKSISAMQFAILTV